MATVEQRSNRFRLIFYFQGKRYTASLKTTSQQEADAAAGSIDRTLMLMQQGVLALPEGADLVTFVLSGGRLEDRPKPPPSLCTLAELKDRYLQAVGVGAMEDNSLDTVRMHLNHFVKTLGTAFSIQTLALSHLQDHVERRAKKKGHFKKPISPVTLKKEMASFRACWNWGVEAGLLTGRFPNKGLKYPKTTDKPPFQTWEEIERHIARGGLSEAEQKELWDCLYLTLGRFRNFWTSSRRTPTTASCTPCWLPSPTPAPGVVSYWPRIDDIDFAGGTILIHEKKRVRGQRHTGECHSRPPWKRCCGPG